MKMEIVLKKNSEPFRTDCCICGEEFCVGYIAAVIKNDGALVCGECAASTPNRFKRKALATAKMSVRQAKRSLRFAESIRTKEIKLPSAVALERAQLAAFPF
jgi:hypothetical protein